MEEDVTFGGGCFWCLEAIFSGLKGVEEVISGYAGGEVKHPSYEQVNSGKTGHAEVVQVKFNPRVISLHDLLTIFFTFHDPTTLGRQGVDIGPQYRSIIFYRTENQRKVVEQVVEEIEQQGIWPNPIVTALEPFTAFYSAEDYHQEYFQRHSKQDYCQAVIAPKLQKLRQLYQKYAR